MILLLLRGSVMIPLRRPLDHRTCAAGRSCRHRPDRQVWAHARQCLGSEALDQRQLVDAVKTAMAPPVLEDGARLARPDAGYGLQRLAVGAVEVHRQRLARPDEDGTERGCEQMAKQIWARCRHVGQTSRTKKDR